MAAWRSALPLLAVAALLAVEDRVFRPACRVSGGHAEIWNRPDDLTVMIVADLLLLGPDAGFVDKFFRDVYTSKFLRKSLEKLQPDMLIVLGDISARGLELAKEKWIAVVQQFQWMLGPYAGLPLHIVLGDRDVGDCSKLDGEFVSWIASKLPGLDSAGCGAFEISNITFVSLNAVSLLCGDNDLRFNVEKVVERESINVRNQANDVAEEHCENDVERATSGNMHWRKNDMASGSGPILLLHFPLHRTKGSSCGKTSFLEENLWQNPYEDSRIHDNSGNVGGELYDSMRTLPPNATEYILQALKPRLLDFQKHIKKVVFTAHTHNFCDYIHSDGTREVTVPAMTWSARTEPGFILASFGPDKGVLVRHCILASESHVIMAYVLVLVLFVAATLVMGWSYFCNNFLFSYIASNSDDTVPQI